MTRLWHHLPNLERLFRSAGERIAGVLHCRRCGFQQGCPARAAAHYLQEGWPLHCGETMLLASNVAPGKASEAGPLPGKAHHPRRS